MRDKYSIKGDYQKGTNLAFLYLYQQIVDMTGFNSYIDGLDLSTLKAYCVNHGRVTQYAKGDYYVKAGEESRFIVFVDCGYFNY